MELIWNGIAAAPVVLWGIILLLPWRPWRADESLDAGPVSPAEDLRDITALIPARNEVGTIRHTLHALSAQGSGLNIVLIDDESTDGTAQIARDAGVSNLTILASAPLPPGWTGKLWALEQGRRLMRTSLTLLLDADIELKPGTLAALRRKMDKERLQLASLMAALPLRGFWEKLLMPAFVYFFMLLYPFRLSNAPRSRVAAAAGGCILIETRVLEEIGGFQAIRGALIDDCALARRVKSAGHRTWIGLTHSARILRHYTLREIWEMVARSAFTQLRYSAPLLALCSLLLILAFCLPLGGLTFPGRDAKFLSVVALALMVATYRPILRFYGLSALWALALPLAGALYLAMTWSSAHRYWRGQRSRWKGRIYAKTPEGNPTTIAKGNHPWDLTP